MGLSITLISGIYNFSKKQFATAIINALLFLVTLSGIGIAALLFAGYTAVGFFIETVDGDKFADNLTIPEGIELHEPKGDWLIIRPDSILNKERTGIDFEIYHAGQPGLYEYDCWLNNMEEGEVYFKAFEITQQYPLSAKQLRRKSRLFVANPSDSLKRFGITDCFTIYEGDWGKPYAARFELWYIPNSTRAERKLMEKNYIIEGWQR